MTLLAWIWATIYCSAGIAMALLARRAKLFAAEPTLLTQNFQFPKVTLIKPVKGANEFTKPNFTSWIEQKYPAEIEYIFSFQDPNDAALTVARKVLESNSDKPIKIIVNPIRDGFSGKTSNLFYGVEAASNEYLIFSDADTKASPFTVREIVLRAEKNKKIVSCLPLHHTSANSWSQLYTTLWNAVLVGLWAPGMLKRKAPGIAGGTVGFYKSDLEKVGGVKTFACFVAEDLKKGALFKAEGYEFSLGPIIESQVDNITKEQFWNACMRGAYVSWNSENGGFKKAIPLYVFAYGYIAFLPWAILTGSAAALPFFLIYVSRVLAHSYFNWLALNQFAFAFHTILSDVTTCAAFMWSIYKRELDWAGVKYKILASGQLQKI